MMPFSKFKCGKAFLWIVRSRLNVLCHANGVTTKFRVTWAFLLSDFGSETTLGLVVVVDSKVWKFFISESASVPFVYLLRILSTLSSSLHVWCLPIFRLPRPEEICHCYHNYFYRYKRKFTEHNYYCYCYYYSSYYYYRRHHYSYY